MSRSLNRVTLIGNLGKDAETKFIPSGVACTRFSIATSRSYKSGEEWKEETDWHNIVLWRSENLANYLTKGKQVYVEGRLQTRSYDKDGQKLYSTEVIATDVILLGGKGESDNSPTSQPRSASQARAPQSAPSSEMIMDDDVPF
jgi:single-strand DNA-binding protein